MRRYRYIVEKFKNVIALYLGEAIGYGVSPERDSTMAQQPQASLVCQDVTTSDRNKKSSPSISYSTGVA